MNVQQTAQRPILRLAGRHAGQHGMALIEALMASAVLAIGLMGSLQLTLKTLQKAQENQQNTVAQMLALEAMDCLHAHVHTPVAACPAQQIVVVQSIRYNRETQISPHVAGRATDLTVRVSWPGQHSAGASVGASAGGFNASPNTLDGPQITWHSSVSALPSWVGVSSP
jgi:Tfp pilus assembly protein PilV